MSGGGVESAKAPLETSLKEEQRMATWIESNIDKVTMAYLTRNQQAA